jgi:hypothetical protein
MTQAVIKNNIFFSVSSAAYPSGWYNNTPGSWGSAVIPIDSLRSLAAAPYNFKEANRHITITNNAYFYPSQIVSKWTQLNTAGISGITPLRPPDFINAQPGMLTNKTSWPYISVASNDSVDPGFTATLVQTAGTKMATFVDTLWHNNQAGKGIRPYMYQLFDPPTWVSVPSTWRTVKGSTYYGYPVPENLRYSNTTLQTKGSDGKALGDLNWFPEQITGVAELPTTLPTKFELSQNYPNPFNPSTKISYTLVTKGMTRLSVFDILGREVAVLVNEVQNAGSHEITFTANTLSSGVYFCKLMNSGSMTTMKMVLMK